ncbi:S4 domain-containing protein [Qipengyuania nanhaisediminis]|uniref:S4 domain-containing protein n=1 Tax=Qipengyuania nanhaisediminis TaxID=604088 RepID=UPI0038B3573E
MNRDAGTGSATDCLRIDRLLVYLRFARTRSAARALIESRSLRCNRKRIERVSETVCVGDVLTLMVGNEVRVIEVLRLPARRASPALAAQHYRERDPHA